MGGARTQVYWVQDDLTFYKLIKLFEADLKQIKVNFYEFKCVGFAYKNQIFKNGGLKLLGAVTWAKEKYCYSHGAYALSLLKMLMQQQRIKSTDLEADVRRKLRGAYVGGRNEFIADYEPRANLFSVDFNAMYLNCLKTKFLSGSIRLKQTSQLDGPGFYYISFESNDQEYPVLFFRNKLTGQGYFCNGRGEGLFWYEEIQLFLEHGGIVHKVHYAYTGDNYTCNFQPFVDEIQQTLSPKLAKNLANNLYGRLAMKDFVYPVKLVTDLEFFLSCEANVVKRWVKWYDFFIYESTAHAAYGGYTDICTAAALTAKARIKLYRLLQSLRGKAQICLLNTDEIIFTSQGAINIDTAWDVKIRPVGEEVFAAKRKMFYTKRKSVAGGASRPFKNINGMLI